jgi:uncharacterized membrane protein
MNISVSSWWVVWAIGWTMGIGIVCCFGTIFCLVEFINWIGKLIELTKEQKPKGLSL